MQAGKRLASVASEGVSEGRQRFSKRADTRGARQDADAVVQSRMLLNGASLAALRTTFGRCFTADSALAAYLTLFFCGSLKRSLDRFAV